MATSFSDYRLSLDLTPAEVKEARRVSAASKASKPAKTKGRGGILSSLISELGGAGGAMGGAAAGAALGSVVPGIGNVIGGIAGGIVGGFAGGTGGRLVENKVRDDRYGLSQALQEGALSGVFGGIGPAWQGAKGLGALGKASGGKGIASGIEALSNIGDDATRSLAGKAISRSGAKAGKAIGQGITGAEDLAYASRKGLQAAGDRSRAAQRGIISGNNGITPADKVTYNRALDDVNKWFSGIGKSKQFENADDALKALTNQYKKAPEAAKSFGSKNADELGTRFLQNIDDNPALKGTLKGKNAQIVNNLLDEALGFSKKKNADFVEFMSSKINPRYRTISSGGSAGSVESQILEAFRDAGKGLIDEKLITRSGVNKQYASLLGASKQLGKTITRDIGAGASQGYSLGRVISDVVGPTRDIAGRGMQQAGKVTKFTTPLLMGTAARGIANGGSEMPQDQLPTDQMIDPTMIDQTQLGPTQINPMATDPMVEQPTQYTLRDALADAQSILGSDATPAQYLAYAKALQAEQTTATKETGPNVTKVTAQQMALAQRGKQSLEQLSQLLQTDPSVLQRSATPGRKLPVVGGFISQAAGTGDFDAMGYNVASALLRLETGAQANESEIRNLQTQLMPRAGDSPETVQTKLAQLNQAFDTILNAAYGNDYGNVDSGNSSFADALAAYGGQ